MRKMVKRYGLAVLAILLAAVTLTGCALSSAAGLEPGSPFLSVSGTFQEVNMDLSGLKYQYYNGQWVQAKEPSFEGTRWVIVELEGSCLMDAYRTSGSEESFSAYAKTAQAETAVAAIEAGHRDFLSRMDADNIEYEYKYSYSTVNNGIAVRLSAEGIKAVKGLPGVREVHYSESYATPTVAVSNNANVYTTGIYNSADLEYKGDGMVVAILDTGLDFSHHAFSHMPTGSDIWTKEYVEQLIAAGGLKADAEVDDVYYNAKIPFAYDYADNDPDVYPSYSTHGTHVAGIVAGLDETKIVNEETGETFVGVAPNAQLVICKVFTDNLDSKSIGGADTIDILAAVSDCVALGVDVINMSLGSSAGFSDEKSDSYINNIYNSVREAGISLVVAASNDYSSGYGGAHGTNLATNPDSGTVGSPSTYAAALSVASINGQEASYIIANQSKTGDDNIAFITEASDESGENLDFIKGLYEATGTPLGEELTLNYVVVNGVGRPGNYTSSVKKALADGKTIALVKRGDITFAEKVQNAMANGAIGVIIYNNLSGTIRMSLGDVEDPIPTCSIGMDAGNRFVESAERGVGTVTFSPNYKAGPFMSEFSSWGPTPDLKLKPEITAHGGEITSAVPGGYDVYSGTSMAAPNMAGAIALLRQHVQKTMGLTGPALNARINQLLMSTATMALDQDGNPYSPRKQGAGLGGIRQAIDTEGYITVLDENGNVYDKTKLELGDDKDRTGIYEMTFTVHNFSEHNATYTPRAYIQTETLASDGKTVAEKAHMLDTCRVTFTANGEVLTGDLTVSAGGSVEVSVRIELDSTARQYLEQVNAEGEKVFENGMYVEGFIRFDAADDATKVDLGIPFLAFYGDWNDAPLFDYSTYELAESQKDTSVDPEDKLQASAAETRPLGSYYEDKYIIPLGSYLYNMSEYDIEIYPSSEKAAVSMFDGKGQHTVYELYMVYAGLLRGAAYMDVEITDAATGEIVYRKREENVGKSYAAGGSNRGSPIMLEINPYEWGMNNNRRYEVKLKGQLDYEGGENPDRNTFEFGFTVDYESPVMKDYRIRYEPYTENKETKYRIYMDIDVYDNQYVQDVMPCYVVGNELRLLTEYPLPVYGEAGSVSTVTFEITDYYDEYIKNGQLYIQVEDYAMNSSVYQINAASALTYPDGISFVENNRLIRDAEDGEGENADGSKYPIYELTLAPNERYRLTVENLPTGSAVETLEWKTTSRVKAKGCEIFAVSAGESRLTLTDGEKTYAVILVSVSGEAGEDPFPERIVIAPVLNDKGHITDLSGEQVTLNPNQTVQFKPSIEPWYCPELNFIFTSSNEKVATVDQVGNVTTHKKGTAFITITAEGYSRLSKAIRIDVGDEFSITNYTLYEYYGGPEVVIPDDKNIMYLDEEAFKGNTTITSVTFPKTLTEIPKNAFAGCTNLREIILPSQCNVIGESAFENCKKLERIVLKRFVDEKTGEDDVGALTVGKNTFRGCTSLTTIENPQRITTAYDRAFADCTALTTLDISGLRVSGQYVFENCTSLTEVTTSSFTSIGQYMFSGCTSLRSFTFKGSRLSDGAFRGCTGLSEFLFDTDSLLLIGNNALDSTSITEITLPNGSFRVGEGAFANCTALETVRLSGNTQMRGEGRSPFIGCTSLTAFTVAPGSSYYTERDGILYSTDLSSVEAVPYAATDIHLPDSVTRIGDRAFAGVAALKEIDLSGITSVGSYAFAESGLEKITLPAGMTALPDGMFYGCQSLSTIENTDQLESIGEYTFFACRLPALTFPNVSTIGAHAFQQSGIITLTAPSVTLVGEYAFAESKIAALEFPKLSGIEYRAFAYAGELTSLTLGAVTKMGDQAFVSSPKLHTVVFAEGTTLIGNEAFASEDARPALVHVILPSTVEYIGAYAFRNATGLTTLNLSGVKTVGESAFFQCTSLTDLDLGQVVTVGEGAFFGTSALTDANLTSAREIGDFAFFESGLTSLTLGALEKIGAYAFTGTGLVTVTLPASFDALTFEDSWYAIGANGKLELVTGKKTDCYGLGAFADIPTLKEILVADGNPVYFSKDGVLYARVADGYTLLQYPAGKTVEGRYEVLADTVRIADSAFEGVHGVPEIEFPYTLRNIGSYAFYQTSIASYIFNSVKAPVLESTFIDASEIDTEGDDIYLLYVFGSRNNISSTCFYANFKDYAAKIIEKSMMTIGYEVPDFGLTMYRPKNGTGYDSEVWGAFFSTEVLSDENMPDVLTHRTNEGIEKLPSVDEIRAILDMTDADAQKAEIVRISEELVRPVRRNYNLITDAMQREMVTDYGKLLDVEQAVRDVRRTLGIEVEILSLEVKRPDQIKYLEGECFNPAGMTVTAIFADESRIIVTDYTLDKTVLTAFDTYVTISYGGKTVTVNVSVTPDGSSETETETETEPETETTAEPTPGKSNILSLVLIIVGGCVVVFLITFTLVIVLKKCKANRAGEVSSSDVESEPADESADEPVNESVKKSSEEEDEQK